MGIRKPLLVSLLGLAPPVLAQDNVLIVVADDIGVDHIEAYGVGSDLPPTPTINGLAANGVLFRNAYSQPVCSPTRAQILTGRQAYRNGMGHIVGPSFVNPELFSLPTEEITLPELLDDATGGLFAHAAIGKWHLHEGLGFETAPNDAGFSHFAGTPTNLGFDPTGYFNWVKVINGTVSVSTNYATTDQVDEALAWISTAPEPWLCYLSFSAAHFPLHVPPAGLHTQDFTGVGPSDVEPRPYYKAMIEAMDTELGRLLTGMGGLVDRTNVFFLTDNGSLNEAVIPPFDPFKAKTTLYQGGVNVPFIVSGPVVGQPGTESTALVGAIDLFATIAELAGVSLPSELPPGYALDSVSIVPQLQDSSTPSHRDTVFAQIFAPLGSGPYTLDGYMIRDERYKLIRVFTPGLPGYPQEFYDLQADPFELTDLFTVGLNPAELDAYRELDRDARAMVRPARSAGPSGSESQTTVASNLPAGGGEAVSANYRVTSQVGVPAASPEVGSASYRASGGVSWTTEGIAPVRPMIFGISPDRGDKVGGQAVDVFGVALEKLQQTSTLDFKLAGRAVVHQPVSDIYLRFATPSGTSALGNPTGVAMVDLFTDDGTFLLQDAFTYLPALTQLAPAVVGKDVPVRFAMNPGETWVLSAGISIPGVGIPVPGFSGVLELVAAAFPVAGPDMSPGGVQDFVFPVPENVALIGSAVDFQGLAIEGFAGEFSNLLRVPVEAGF